MKYEAGEQRRQCGRGLAHSAAAAAAALRLSGRGQPARQHLTSPAAVL